MLSKRILSSIITIALCASFMLPVNTFAAASFTGGTNVSGGLNVPVAITDLQVTGVAGGDTVPVFLYVPNGSLSMTTTTGLTFTGASAGQRLYFSGTLTNVNTALTTLRYTHSSAGAFTLEASIIGSGQIYDPTTQHIYEVIDHGSNITGGTARTAALARSLNGVTGYLANITSSDENNFISARLSQDGWFGASDAGLEGTWKWLDGPEAGTTFWIGTWTGSAQNGSYTNWAGDEPNQSGDEDCSQFYANGSGWNDLGCDGNVSSYVVEYGAPGSLPTVASDTLTITLSADSITQTPVLSSPTSTSRQRILQLTYSLPEVPTAGTVNVAFNNGTTTTTLVMGDSQSVNTTVNLASLISTNGVISTTASSLADGTYTVTLSYQDYLGNPASTALATVVIIDTTPPVISQITAVTTPTNDNTPHYTFTTNEAGEITFGGACASDTLHTTLGSNTIALNFGNVSVFADGTYSNCTITVTDTATNVSNTLAVPSFTVDTTAPIISALSSALLSPPGATITWTTHEGATSQIEYGITDTYGSTTTADNTLVTSHTVNVVTLTGGSVYHYRIITRDALGNTTTSSNNTFMTRVVPGGGGGDSIQYGCKDPKATNYRADGVVGQQSLCKYPTETVTPIKKPIATVKTGSTEQKNDSPVTKLSSAPLKCETEKFLTTPIRFGSKNAPEDVKLLEKFLNTYENAGIPIDGIYSREDYNAVIRWQEKYADTILKPWGLKKGTGYVFRTSLAQIKELEENACKNK